MGNGKYIKSKQLCNNERLRLPRRPSEEGLPRNDSSSSE